jgi:hypothetical protein
MRNLLTTVFHVEDDDLSPFCTTFTDDISSIRDCYVAYMPAGDEHAVPGGGDNENDHSNESDEETNIDGEISVSLTEAMAEGIVDCDDSDDDESRSDGDDIDHEEFVQCIYGETDVNNVIQTFANLVTVSSANKSTWRGLVDAGLQALRMKGREQGAISSSQKFKGLNYRWFGSSKVKGAVDGKTDSENTIKRGAVVVIKKHPANTFLVLAVFSKHYNKWFPTHDTPAWNGVLSKESPYRISVRQIEYDSMLFRYEHVQVSPTSSGDVAFQLINLEQVTQLVDHLD